MAGMQDTAPSRRLSYLCLQATSEGQASHVHVHAILDGLSARGWDCRLFEPDYASKTQRPPVPARLLEYERVRRRLAQALPCTDVLYVRDHEAALTAMRDAHRRNVPIVLEVNAPHDEIAVSYPWLAPVLPRLERSFAHRLRLADRIIVVAEGMKRFLEDRYRLHASVVPNGADPERFRPDACRLRPARPYAVFVGVLARWQGLETILDAAARPEWPSGLDLIVAGDGVMRERVEAAAAAAEHVRFLGPVPFADVPSLLAGASASLVATTASRSFAAPETLSEPGWAKPGFSPVKLYESMASGVPLVVTDVPGQAEVVRAAGAGLVVPAADAEAMASAVADLVRDPEKARSMGERGRIAVLREHSWQARAAATEAVIVEAMDARRAVGA